MRSVSRKVCRSFMVLFLTLVLFGNVGRASGVSSRESRIFAMKADRAGIETIHWESIDGWGPGDRYNYSDPILVTPDLETSAHLTWTEQDDYYFKGIYLGRFNNGHWDVITAPMANHIIGDRWPQHCLLVDEQDQDHLFWMVNDSSIMYTSYDGAEWTPLTKLAQKVPNGHRFNVQLGSNGTIYLYWEDKLWIGDSSGNGTLLEVPALEPYTRGQLFWRGDQTIDVIFECSFLNLCHISSTDNGATWTDPTTIIAMPRPNAPHGGGAAAPSVYLDHNGDFHVAYSPFISWEDQSPCMEDWYLIYAHQNNSKWMPQVELEKISGPRTEDWYMILDVPALLVLPDNTVYFFWWLLETDQTIVYLSIIDEEGKYLAKSQIAEANGFVKGLSATTPSAELLQVFFVAHWWAKDNSSDNSSTATSPDFGVISTIGSILVATTLLRTAKKKESKIKGRKSHFLFPHEVLSSSSIVFGFSITHL